MARKSEPIKSILLVVCLSRSPLGPVRLSRRGDRTSTGSTRHGAVPFEKIALVGGRFCVEVMHALVRGGEMGCERCDARVRGIDGPVGRMRQDVWTQSGSGFRRMGGLVQGRLILEDQPRLKRCRRTCVPGARRRAST